MGFRTLTLNKMSVHLPVFYLSSKLTSTVAARILEFYVKQSAHYSGMSYYLGTFIAQTAKIN